MRDTHFQAAVYRLNFCVGVIEIYLIARFVIPSEAKEPAFLLPHFDLASEGAICPFTKN